MDLFDETLRGELGENYDGLLQIIDDYLERPRRSYSDILNKAEGLIQQVKQQTYEIESATQLTTDPPLASESSNGNTPPQTARSRMPQAATEPEDDDVYILSEPLSPRPVIIDLCTPDNYVRRKRRTRRPINEVITLHDSSVEDDHPKRTSLSSTLKASPHESERSESTGVKLKCAVCMDDPTKHKPSATICGHIFCKKCIDRAIKISKKCPLCNKKLNSSAVHRIFF